MSINFSEYNDPVNEKDVRELEPYNEKLKDIDSFKNVPTSNDSMQQLMDFKELVDIFPSSKPKQDFIRKSVESMKSMSSQKNLANIYNLPKRGSKII